MKKPLFLVLVFLLLINLSFAQIIHIPADYATIQAGINAAANGDTVLVDTGTYFENLIIEDKSLILASNYLLTQDTSYISETIIDGNSEGSVITINNSGDSLMSICGFTLQNGSGYYDGSYFYGGGVYCDSSNLKLNNLKICNNSAISMYHRGFGGGITCTSSQVEIDSVELYNNRSSYGGGIAFGRVDAVIRNSMINYNLSDKDGGGIYISGNDSIPHTVDFYNVEILYNRSEIDGGGLFCTTDLIISLTDSKIIGNYAEEDGGGIRIGSTNAYLRNVVVNENYCRGNGGGFYSRGCDVDIRNSIFLHNVAYSTAGLSIGYNYFEPHQIINTTIVENYSMNEYSCGGISIYGNNAFLTNSIICNNDNYQMSFSSSSYVSDTLFVSNTNLMGGEDEIYSANAVINWLEGNIDEDPLFVDSGEHPCQINDYSPCIDAGTPDTTGLNLPEFDLADELRIFNERVDMGAYEWNTFVGENEIEVQNLKLKVDCFPNPLITSTTIAYSLQQPSTIQITIYNHLGKQVEIIQQKQSSGKQQVVWNAERFPSGMYYFTLQAGAQLTSGKMVVLR